VHHGLVFADGFQSSRFAARTAIGQADPGSRTEPDQVGQGAADPARASAPERSANALQRNVRRWGPYASAGCRPSARRGADATETDWARIVLLSDGCVQIAPSPVVRSHRAVARAMASSPRTGIGIVTNWNGLAARIFCRSCGGDSGPAAAAPPRPPMSSTGPRRLTDHEAWERAVLRQSRSAASG